MAKPKVTAKEIESSIFRKYEGQGYWIVLREVSIDDMDVLEEQLSRSKSTTSIGNAEYLARKRAGKAGRPSKRRIDVLLVSHKRGKGSKVPRERIALEIKVSRADFKADSAEKRAPWRRHVDKYAYVAPKGMISKEELPEGCGLLEYDPEAAFDRLKWKVNAPLVPVEDRRFNENFFHYILNRLYEAEHRLRVIST